VSARAIRPPFLRFKPGACRYLRRDKTLGVNVEEDKIIFRMFSQLLYLSMCIVASGYAGSPKSGPIWEFLEYIVFTPHRGYLAHGLCQILPGAERSIVENNAQERFINVNVMAGVFDEAQIPKFVHEEVDSGARCPNHFG
jgi:hypothetical protein